ncbi:DgyrCDS13796 [Dimorphilus gyrociliatus]|uniref:DgyrCDS13796 n=1 Tax=Dimorphilus gyrociliatus TaxID=2664684 RepID=A0A7I8WBQ7_9ANNE|nr:DgyrCDS13796 [Dimorphilus gyrociliatus]
MKIERLVLTFFTFYHINVYASTEIELNTTKTFLIKVYEDSKITFYSSKIPLNVSFVLFEFHSKHDEFTISKDESFQVGDYTTSSDAGILIPMKGGETVAKCYFTNKLNSTFDLYSRVKYLSSHDPIPGGCNQELPLENDPNIYWRNEKLTTQLKFAFANKAVSRGTPEVSCEDAKVQQAFKYDIYHMFLREGNYNNKHKMEIINKLNDINSIQKYGNKLKTVYSNHLPTFYIAMLPSIGSAFTVRGTYNGEETVQFTYVPSVTYSCSFESGDKSCRYPYPLRVYIITGVLAILGLYIAFGAHTLFLLEIFILSYLEGFLSFYIVISRYTDWSEGVQAGVIAACSLSFAIAGLLVWKIIELPILSVILMSLLEGFLFSSLIFNVTPFGQLEFFNNSLTYGFAFAAIMLLPSLILMNFPKWLNYFTCAVVGSYMLIFPIGLVINSGFPLVVMATLHRAAIPGYINTIVYLPVQYRDIILYCLWLLVIVLAIIFNWARDRHRSDFPMTRRERRQMQKESEEYFRRLAQQEQVRNYQQNMSNNPNYPNERTHLLDVRFM